MADLETSSSKNETQKPNPEELDRTREDGLDAQSASDEEEPTNRRGRRAAASQARKQRLREREEAEAVGLDAQEMIDDALVRSTDSASKWFRNNSSWLQGVVVVGIAVWAGWGIYGWRTAAAQAAATAKVSIAVEAERGRVGEPPADADPDFPDPTPLFKDDAERIKAATAAFEAAAKERPGSGTSAYSKLALAALKLDEKKFDDAKAAFQALKNDSFAASDPEFRGRSLEGIALALEGKGDKAAAKEAYAALEAAAIPGFVELALYHQARLAKELGEDDSARVLAEKLNKALSKNERLKPGVGYLGQVSKMLSQELGVKTAEEEAPAAPGKITPAQLKALQEQMQRAIQDKVPAPGSGAPAPGAAGAAGK